MIDIAGCLGLKMWIKFGIIVKYFLIHLDEYLSISACHKGNCAYWMICKIALLKYSHHLSKGRKLYKYVLLISFPFQR